MEVSMTPVRGLFCWHGTDKAASVGLCQTQSSIFHEDGYRGHQGLEVARVQELCWVMSVKV